MDEFKNAQLKDIGWGGIKCRCCNSLARKKCRSKVDKKLNRRARARLKHDMKRLLKNYYNNSNI